MSFFERLKAIVAPDAPSIAPRARLIGGLIALVAASMGFLASAGALTGLAADRIAGRWTTELSAVATVRVTAPEAELAQRVQAALKALGETPGIESARALTVEESRALLAPWLGAESDVAALPVPALIDVKMTPRGPDVDALQDRLELEAPGARWDDHREWRAPLILAARGLRTVATAGVIVSILALAAMIAVSAIASLRSGDGIVRTLKLIGADDRFISRAFERPFAMRAAVGAGLGALAAALISLGMPKIEGIEVFTVDEMGVDWRIAMLLPAAAALIAGLTALGATRAAAYFVLHKKR